MAADPAPFWRAQSNGVSVAIKLHPAARRPGVQGTVPDIAGSRLKIAVTEPPEDGRANRAACATLAAALGIPVASIAIIQGAASRQKTLHISGDPAAIAQKLAAL